MNKTQAFVSAVKAMQQKQKEAAQAAPKAASQEIQVVRFRIDYSKVAASIMPRLVASPCETLHVFFEYQSFYRKTLLGHSGDLVRMIPFVKGDYPYEATPCGVETMYVTAAHIDQYRHDLELLEEFFTPNVAVGDLLVPVMSGNRHCQVGYICGEGNEWKRVCLADNNEYHAEADTTPCIGSEYARAALGYLQGSKAA